ncbi:MAG: hypothetical protein EOP58_01580 [Sphingomonadales bacterium]|nr:MAG: hypothetical protein EOP58_01580 [Sphingomonadales bacterium]
MRYAIAGVGPISAAVAQFALTLVLLRHLDVAAFGTFGFLLVVSQFSLGIWSALLCAPLPVLENLSHENPDAPNFSDSLFAVNLLGSAVVAIGFGVLAWQLEMRAATAALFAGYAGAALLRWFARANAYVAGQPLRTLTSDLVYSGTLALGVLYLIFDSADALGTATFVLLLGAVLGMVPFGWSFARSQFRLSLWRDLTSYRAVWQGQARWSVLGVATSELTGNAHVYIVTAVYGPSSYAAIAASALLVRPITVIQNALTEFERPQMARQVRERNLAGLQSNARIFMAALVAAWLATAVASALVLAFVPRLIFPPQYDLWTLELTAALWLAVALARLVRTPGSTLLQAGGLFRELANTSIASAVVSVVAVVLLVAVAGSLWSIAGILLGELICAFLIARTTRSWFDQIGKVQDAADDRD